MRQLQLEELGRRNADEFKAIPKIPLIIALDNIRSGHNVGSVFRTADAFKMQGLILGGYTPIPPDPEIHKTALGAQDVVEWTHHTDLISALKVLKKEGYILLAAEQTDQSTPLHKITLHKSEKFVLILGNEVRGVSAELLEICDGAVEIPQEGTKHSLNVSVAAGVIMWEFFKQLNSH